MTEQEWLVSRNPQAMLRWRNQALTGLDFPTDRKLRLFAAACCRQVWHLLTDPRSRRAVEVAERYADGLATEGELMGAENDAAVACAEAPGQPAEAWDAAACCYQDAAEAAADIIRAPHSCPPATQAALHRCVFGNPFRPVALSESVECPVCRGAKVFPARMAAELSGCYDACSVCHGTGAVRQSPVWLTPAVRQIAQAIYDEGRWAELGVLADALEEAGCTDPPGRTVSQIIAARKSAVMGGCCDRFADQMACDCLEKATPDGLLAHLRSPGPHCRGCHATDAILRRE